MKLYDPTFSKTFGWRWSTLRANKLRSFLTVFGVIIGVITVMLIASIISGHRHGGDARSRIVRHPLDVHQQVRSRHSRRPHVRAKSECARS